MEVNSTSTGQEVDQLVDTLVKAASEAERGDQQAIDLALQSVECLKKLKVVPKTCSSG